MGAREDAENERGSNAMVDGVKPVAYWRQRPTRDRLADGFEQRVVELERRLSDELHNRQ